MSYVHLVSLLVSAIVMVNQATPPVQELAGSWSVTITWTSIGTSAIASGSGITAQVVFAPDSSTEAQQSFPNKEVLGGVAERKNMKNEPLSPARWFLTVHDGKVLLAAGATGDCVATLQTANELRGNCLGQFDTRGKISAVRNTR